MDECQVNVEECTKVQVFYNAEHGSATRKIHDLQMDLESKRDQLVRVNQYEGNKAALDAKVEASLAAKQAKLELYEDETNPHIALHGRANEQHDEAADAEFAAYEHYTNLKEELDHLVYWRDVYSKELKLKLFEEACPFLDARVAYHLGRLKNEQITCEFTTVKRLSDGAAREEFNVKVTSTTGGDGFDSLSGGEQQMVSFAVGLALSDLAKSASTHSSSIVILDEPFTELDERNGEAVVEYLTSEVENGQDTVLLISNEETLKGLVPNRIHVVKRKGITNVN
jgi:DNA repair exonuclease SbcCD ATPase subunit